MSKNITLQELSIANFDQLLDIDGIKGAGRRSYSKRSYSRPSYSKPSYSRRSVTTYKRRRR